MMGKFLRILFGHDIFISYSRKDSLDYSYNLARHFMDKGYDCYIDQLSSTSPGNKLPPNISRAVTKSTCLVIIGSASANSSSPIEEEITAFLRSGKNRPIIPINVNGSIFQARWYKDIAGLALIDEKQESLNNHTPSKEVLDRIANSIKFTRKSAKLRSVSIGVLMLTIVLLVLAAFLGLNAQQASKAQKQAELNVKKQQVQLGQLQKVRKDVEGKLSNSIRNLSLAEQSLKEEQIKVKIAREQFKKEQLRSALIRKEADNYLSVARLRDKSAREFLSFVENGIESLYSQPSFTTCKPENITSRNPLSIYIYMDRIGMSQLKKENILLLDSLVNCLKERDEFMISVESHTSKYTWFNEKAEALRNEDAGAIQLFKPTEAYRRQVSETISKSVMQYLISKGIPAKRIIGKAYGPSRPRYALDLMNNRVEIIVTGKEEYQS